jgi:hypothetical protein
MAPSGIWPLLLAVLGATTAALWWRLRLQHGPSTPGWPPSRRHVRLAVVPVRNSTSRRGVPTARGRTEGLEGTR